MSVESGTFASMEDLLTMPFDQLRGEVFANSGPPLTSTALTLNGERSTFSNSGPRYVQRTSTRFPQRTGSRLQQEDFPPFDLGFPLENMLASFVRLGTNRRAPSSMTYDQMLSLDRENAKRGVLPAAVKRLKRRRPRRAEKEASCHICLGSIARARSVLDLPCGHAFCEGCILEWLREHHTCPVCRWEFPEKDTHVVGLSEHHRL